MEGTRDPHIKLYMLNLTQQNKLMTESTTPNKYFAGSAYECKSKSTLVDYHYSSCWRPIQSGWGKEITKKVFTSSQGLSFDLVHKYLSKKQSTILRHIQQPRKCLRSTQEKLIQSDPAREQDQFPPSTQSRDTNLVFLNTLDLTGKFYTDQTGRFTVTSSKGKQYKLVAYHYEYNTIHAEPLKTISGLYLKTSYQKLHSLLTNRGLKPHLHILDNECPNVLNKLTRVVLTESSHLPPLLIY